MTKEHLAVEKRDLLCGSPKFQAMFNGYQISHDSNMLWMDEKRLYSRSSWILSPLRTVVSQ